jgi:transcriptional regulator with XRE-family HTH domain
VSEREHELLDLGQAFGAELRQLRLDACLTGAEAAAKVGIARPNYARAEKGMHTPRLEMMVRAAEVFGLDPVDFFRRVVERARRAAASQPANQTEET